MSLDSITLRISTPTEPIASGRGFYQLEEDILYVQIGTFSGERKFYSYIESESLRLDIDKSGHLIFLEYKLPRKLWPIDDNFSSPKTLESADLKWIDFRERVGDPAVYTNNNKSKICFRFSDNPAKYSFYLAESIFLQVDEKDYLVAIWIDDITDDIAGREISAFRKKVRGRKSFFKEESKQK